MEAIINLKPPLDEKLWDVFPFEDGELEFLKSQTGIHDSDTLKKHVLAVQAKAYELYPYYCVKSFSFTRIKIHCLPAYPRVLSLVRERPNAIMLDLGSCFGTDIRKVAADGFPLENLVASDLRQGFWDLGHELFQSTPETFPVSFLAGDIFDRTFLVPAAAVSTSTSSIEPPTLSNLTSLTALNGKISILHASLFFHLFNEQKQTELAHLLAGLLCPLPGSMIFGSHVGREIKGLGNQALRGSGHQMFCHSPDSWIELWENIFPKGTVRVEAILKEHPQYHRLVLELPEKPDDGVLEWSCVRL
ncbi:hypothetical protein K438DRAFT_1962099 [Mycena galopus ATCC 62051]|nr:hypothetical protein K438DRAFT_1962099 [Mycena galopus ATCC 62051]